MQIGVLYESDEWSDHKLASELKDALAAPSPAVPATVTEINMQDDDSVSDALQYDILVSRVFASAAFRDHQKSLDHMDSLIEQLDGIDILMLNAPEAHAFEISKQVACDALAQAGIPAPLVQQSGLPAQLDPNAIEYPCVIKPNCGGRTTHTAIAHNPQEAANFLATAPSIELIAQDYIEPERGFITRVEIVGGKTVLSVKRSIADNGLSAYRFGSTYAIYDDMPEAIAQLAEYAARALNFTFGSFDIIETEDAPFFIDANSVSNVSEDCTEMFHCDLMRLYAEEIAKIAHARMHGNPTAQGTPIGNHQSNQHNCEQSHAKGD